MTPTQPPMDRVLSAGVRDWTCLRLVGSVVARLGQETTVAAIESEVPTPNEESAPATGALAQREVPANLHDPVRPRAPM